MFMNLMDFILNFYYMFENKTNLNGFYFFLKNYYFFFLNIKFLFFTFTDLLMFKYLFSLNPFEINYIYFNKSMIYGLKFSMSMLFLMFISAGIPSYSYDFLTMLGWNSFFFLTFIIFILLLVQYLI